MYTGVVDDAKSDLINGKEKAFLFRTGCTTINLV